MEIRAVEIVPDVPWTEHDARRFLERGLETCRVFLRGYCGKRRYWRGLSSGLMGSMIAEAVQEAGARFLREARRFDPARSKPQTWLNNLALWKLRVILRRHFADQERNAPLETADPVFVAPFREATLRVAVEQTLERMVPAQAHAVRLHYLRGLPVREVAALMERGEIPVQSLLQRARESFARFWDDRTDTP